MSNNQSTETTYLEAIRQALFEEMRRDSSVFCIGEDIGAFGGAFKVTKGLLEEFGAERVIDTPISESGAMGVAIGAAMAGMRPIIEMQFADFVSNAFTNIVFNAAKSYFRSGIAVPLVIRLPAGGGVSGGPFHSSNPEAWFANVPGLKIVAPSTANNARGLLKAAVRDNNPVIYLEHKYLYRRQKEVLTEQDGTIEIGRARIARSGDALTIVTYGAMVQRALTVAEQYASKGVGAEVIDLQTLLPWDQQCVRKSVAKTHRVLVLHEATRTGGFGGEIAASIAESCFEFLDAPVTRLASHDTPVPFSPVLEQFFMPGEQAIASKLQELLEY